MSAMPALPSSSTPNRAGSWRSTLLAAGSLTAFILLSASIVVISSERMFWFWSTSLADHVLVSAYYGIATAGTFGIISRYRVTEPWRLLLVAAVFAYLVEGVLTPVMYEGFGLPIMPMLFFGWHGLLSFMVLWYLVRRWLLAGRWAPLLAVSVGFGLLWAVWSTTLRLPENVNDPDLVADHGGALTVLDPAAFTRYALTFSIVLAASHYLQSFVWPTEFRPRRAAVIAWQVVAGAMLLAWSILVPWALPVFVLYCGLQFWALRRSTPPVAVPIETAGMLDAETGDAIDPPRPFLPELAGRFAVYRLWPLAAIPAVAVPTYALLWELDPSDAVIRDGIMDPMLFVIVTTALGVLGWSLWRALRRSSPVVRPASVPA